MTVCVDNLRSNSTSMSFGVTFLFLHTEAGPLLKAVRNTRILIYVPKVPEFFEHDVVIKGFRLFSRGALRSIFPFMRSMLFAATVIFGPLQPDPARSTEKTLNTS